VTILVEAVAEPEPNQAEIGDAEPAPESITVADRLRLVYVGRVDAYRRELATALNVQAHEGAGLPVSAYPSLPVLLDGEETLVIDDDLFTSLIDVYVVHGWSGVATIGEALEHKVRSGNAQPAGGTTVTVWRAAWSFFVYTYNLLALLVRDGLMEIERKAAIRIISRLSICAAALARAWRAELQLVRTMKTVSGGRAGAVQVPTYTMSNVGLAEALFKALTEAVHQRARFDQLVQEITNVRERIRLTRPKTKPTLNHPRPRKKYTQQLRRLQATEAQLVSVREATKGFYASMAAVIHMSCPLALLIIDGLRPGFAKEEMEQLLGEALWTMYSRLDELGAGIDPQASRTRADLPFAYPPDRFDRLAVGREGPEGALVDVALARLAEDPAYFALLHETTLHEMAQSGEIEKDSLAGVVYHHYTLTLVDKLEARRQQEEGAKAFWTAFSKGAAALSLATLFTPAAELAPLVRGAAFIADLVLISHTVSSAVEQLAHLEEVLGDRLIGPDVFALENLARVGELCALRRDFIAELSEQVFLELVLIAAGARFLPVKKLLMARGYLLDIETLFGDG